MCFENCCIWKEIKNTTIFLTFTNFIFFGELKTQVVFEKFLTFLLLRLFKRTKNIVAFLEGQ